jgi:hypothetical protein
MTTSDTQPDDGHDQGRQLVAVGDLVITWYDDEPVLYGGDAEGAYSTLTFGLLDDRLPERKCDPRQVAPADVAIPAQDPRVEVVRGTRAEKPYGAPGIWKLTVPGQEQPTWHRTKREATATGLRRVAIFDWHARRAARDPGYDRCVICHREGHLPGTFDGHPYTPPGWDRGGARG